MARRSDAVLERLTRLHPKIIDLSLGRVETLLERLDHPERSLPPTIHVAGTNGKGSLISYLRAMLALGGDPEAGSNRVHAYTSPHLVRFHERIELDGQLIDEDLLVELLEECETANLGESITYFEITTVAAFLAFARTPADVLLLETGLGGRLDATNVLERPRLTAITPISIDHVQFLGNEKETIAAEKAGILKAGVPCVVAPQEPSVMAVFEAKAAELGVSLYRGGIDWDVEALEDGFRFSGRKGSFHYPTPALPGAHQVVNAAVAVACAEQLGEFHPKTAEGITGAVWPARMQRLTKGPLLELLGVEPDGGDGADRRWELWIDGGHNAAAGEALAEVIAAWDDRPVHLIYGMLNTKVAEDFVRPLAEKASSLHAVAIPDATASLTADEAKSHAVAQGFAATSSPSVEAAISDINARFPGGRILVCGSLYLAGHILADNS
ncbi:bifunctional folylpolyglutamate synthase/dihydrofolate synthase [Denitrobaculum tricleocarpae]|uniref:Dihydrofolate synthase/folylpolyglutamate synthase n=1 Tax=Denitrobaculum tricleocarpae TaxID=2591009 RepID=A0A545TG65_9PROT|nr:folylpolyglutamate synthase/dihydrofolate synthase family protein [Denitrobaculum tricleocarpae]TQV76195.1 bifunctional folylpolyglutamate synthase/dihydrofolate synthase [Denitrobaculum tricleocarpae]